MSCYSFYPPEEDGFQLNAFDLLFPYFNQDEYNSLRLMCLNLSKGRFTEYEKLMETDIIELYEFMTMQNALTIVSNEKQKFEMEKDKNKI